MQFKKFQIILSLFVCSLVLSSPVDYRKIDDVDTTLKKHTCYVKVHKHKNHNVALGNDKVSHEVNESESDNEIIQIDSGVEVEEIVESDNEIDEINKGSIDESNKGSIEGSTDEITVTDEFQKLTEDFSVVEFRGDYGLDTLLNNGGAADDTDSIDFVLSYNGYNFNRTISLVNNRMACSAMQVPNKNGNGYLFGRDFDWFTCNGLVLVNYPKTGFASISTVNTDFIKNDSGMELSDDIMKLISVVTPLDGINEKGLSISVNVVAAYEGDLGHINPGKGNLTTVLAIRTMLDKADTVDKALEILKTFNLNFSFDLNIHYLIADNTGKSAVVEFFKNEMYVTETPVMTNFYLSPEIPIGKNPGKNETAYEYLSKSDKGRLNNILAENPESIEELKKTTIYDDRYDVINERLIANPKMTLEEVRDTMKAVSQDSYESEDMGTEWTVIFDQQNLEATYYRRLNYEHGFQIKLDTKKTSSSNDQIER